MELLPVRYLVVCGVVGAGQLESIVVDQLWLLLLPFHPAQFKAVVTLDWQKNNQESLDKSSVAESVCFLTASVICRLRLQNH